MKVKPFAAVLKAAIEASGKTIAEVAQAADISAASVYHLRNGTRTDPPWSTVQALADTLGISTDSLRTKGV